MTEGGRRRRGGGGARLYSVYGHRLGCRRPLRHHLLAAEPPADLEFSYAPEPLERSVAERRLLGRSPFRDAAGRSVAELYGWQDGELLRFAEGLEFGLTGDRIICHVRQPAAAPVAELRLLGPVMAYWLERRGLPVLHASAVCLDDLAVAFAAGRRGGKSSLAAVFLERGAALLGDDVLALRCDADGCVGLPSYPELRLWPPAAERLLPGRMATARVHPELDKQVVAVGEGGFGRFRASAARVARIYLLEREERAGRIELRATTPRDAVIDLLRCSFTPFLAEAAGRRALRLERLAQLAETVPVRRLSFPSGFERLPEVRQAVLRDLEAGSWDR